MKKLNIFKTATLGAVVVSPTLFTFVSCSQTVDEVAILFTNDTHCALENKDTGLGWTTLKGYRNWLENKGIDTLLVDSGDFAQGGKYGTVSAGRNMVDMMNVCDYDVVIPGNHEFDYGMDGFYNIERWLNCPMISTNLYHCHEELKDAKKEIVRDGRVLDDTAILSAGKYKIGFVGVSTPSTLKSSNPSHFKDEDGKQIYSFSADKDGEFFSTIQASIDHLHEQNVDYVIALTHAGIGDDAEYKTSGSKVIIENTTGLNAVLDGHSHTLQHATKIKDAAGKDVYLAQTGTQFDSIGKLTIRSNGSLKFSSIESTEDIKESTIDKKAEKVANRVEKTTDEICGEAINGAIPTDIEGFDALYVKDPDSGFEKSPRICRDQECSLGDFTADAIRYCYDEDIKKLIEDNIIPDEDHVIACLNGGNIRENIKNNSDGKVTKGDLLNVQPFANTIGIMQLKLQTLVDALEYSVAFTQEKHFSDEGEPIDEFGGFFQVDKNVKIVVNLIKSPVISDDSGFIGLEKGAKRRIESITIGNTTIDPNNLGDKADDLYYLISSDFTLLSAGDGYNMFKNDDCQGVPLPLTEDPMVDVEVLADRFEKLSAPEMHEEWRHYVNPKGEGRIVLKAA